MNATPTASAPGGAPDWIEIVQATTRMAWLADRRDWAALTAVFADEVDVDYTSLAGGEPARLAATQLVAGWRAGLGGLDATQHLIGNHLVDVHGDRATVTAQFQATHVFANPHGDHSWTLGGHYRFGLVVQGGRWRIDAVTMTATWAAGNQQIMTLAAEAAS